MASPRLASDHDQRRQRDPEQTRDDILGVAAKEFAGRGFDGARVDQIAASTQTTKRMIYYYFGSKEGLFIAVLERAYAGLRAAEQSIDVEHLEPVAAIRRLAELTFDYHQANPEFARLVAIENIHHAEHLKSSPSFARLNSPALEVIGRILDRGRHEGTFARNVDAIDVHMMISAFCVFRIANRHTFGALFERDLASARLRDHYRAMLSDMVVAYLTSR